MTSIRFHIGAHKTATTHLQMTLAGCSFEAGTRHVPLKRLRRTLTSPVRKQRLHLPWHRWYRGTWLFSDENILGTTANALELYPDPAHALRHFMDCDLSIFLAVRSYDSFFSSAYGERLWHHPWQPFEARMPQRRWTDLVADLQRDLPDVPIHVWRYEDYRNHASDIAQYYAGGMIREFGPPLRENPKSGFSARAVEEMAEFADRRPRKSRVLAIRDRFPVGDEYPRFDPWTTDQRQQLQSLYAEDVERLAQQVEVWRPARS